MSAQDVLAKFQTAPLYHPASTELFDDITLQAGDVVKVSSDGTEYNLPIYSQHILWNGTGMISVESTGNEKRDPLPALRRKQYGYGSRVHKVEEEVDGYYTDYINSKYDIGMVAGALGVVLDSDGRPQYDPITGKLVYDETSSAEIFTKLILSANRGQLISAINNNTSATNIISYGMVQVQPGSVLIEAINNRGSSSNITLRADVIDIDGIVTELGAKHVGVGSLTVEGLTDFYRGVYAEDAITSDEHIWAGTYVRSETGYMLGNTTIIDSTGALSNLTIGGETIVNGISAVQIDGPSNNQYKLQFKRYGDSTWTDAGTFSRATTLRGGFGSGTQADPYHYWQSGIFKVQADPQGATRQTSLTTSGHWGVAADDEDDKTYYGTVKATIDSSPTLVDTGKTFEVNASAIWQAGYDAGGGGQITTPTLTVNWGSTAQDTGRFTVNTTPTAATNPLEYWFSSGAESWNGNVATIPIQTAPSQTGTTTTRFNVTLNATPRYNAGWGDAQDDVHMPSAVSTETTSFVVTTPNATVGGNPVSNTFNLSKSSTPSANGNVYVNLNGSNVAQIGIGNYYTAGLDYGKVIDSITESWAKTGSSADKTNTLTITATSQGGGSDTDSVGIALSFGSSWNGTNFPVNLKEDTTIIGKTNVTCWLYYATNQSGHGANPQGDLPVDSYMCLGFTDDNGNVIKNESYTWKVPGTHPTVSGSWNGSGTYNITTNPSAASGKTQIKPTVELAGGTAADSFWANLMSDDSNPSVQAHVVGYMGTSGSGSTRKAHVYKDSAKTVSIAEISVPDSGTLPPNSHVNLESGGHYAPSYSGGGTQLSSWVSTLRQAVNSNGYFYFNAWISDNGSSNAKRYYIKF